MGSLRTALSLGAVMLMFGAHSAAAADLFGGSIKDDAGSYEPVPMPVSSPRPSIYFRVDGGYSAYDTPEITESDIWTLTETSIGGQWSDGGGVGMYFGGGFRGDITVDHMFESDVEANHADPFSDLPGNRSFGLSSTVALANLYYDFNFGSRFTPYIGVGLGFTHNKTSDGDVTDPCGCYIGEIEGDSEMHVAAAAMAGFSLKLRGGTHEVQQFSVKDAPVYTPSSARSLFLDVGYRFLYLGEARTGPVTATYTSDYNGNLTGEEVSQDPVVEDIHAHQIRVGLRYNIN